jgi:quinol-cytochrome oxidoreductase complex cytochrome b subunit/coenzyme F420-reducing hydrogenase delta subunit
MRAWVLHITPLNKIFQFIAYNLSRVFSSRLNPLYYLGALTVYLLIIDAISGIYLLLFYKIDPRLSYESVEAISSQFIGNIMRGIHRYSSDALIVSTIAHMIHVIVTDKFRQFRWIAWVSGVATIFIFLFIGVSGYILVWDEKAQLVSLLTAKFLTFLPVFGNALMSTILGTDIKNLGGIFRALLFGHIALTLLIIFTLWVHVVRISRPKLIPPTYLAITVTLGLILLSTFFPAESDAPANLSKIPFGMSLDVFYLFGYPFIKLIPPSYYWLLSIGTIVLLTILPWLIRGERNPQAHISIDKCVGCEQCYIDCPYRAIIMQNINDKKKAILNENKCSGCGTCVGSCPVHAVDIPSFDENRILKAIDEKRPEIVVIRCVFAAKPPPREDAISFTVPCVGVVNPRYAEKILDKGVRGLLMISCEIRDCHFREGNIWTDERYQGKRIPKLKKHTDPSRIRILHAPHFKNISRDLDDFRKDLIEGKKTKNVLIKLPSRVNYVLASLLLIVPLFVFYPLTTYRVTFYPEDKSIIAISFKYRSTPIKRSISVPVAFKGDRSPIEVEVIMNGNSIYSKTFYPRGLRGDAAIYVFEELLLDPQKANIVIKITETVLPDKTIELKLTRSFKPRDTLYITYDDLHKRLIAL